MVVSWNKELGFYSKYNGESPQRPHPGVSWCDLLSVVWDDPLPCELNLFKKALDWNAFKESLLQARKLLWRVTNRMQWKETII